MIKVQHIQGHGIGPSLIVFLGETFPMISWETWTKIVCKTHGPRKLITNLPLHDSQNYYHLILYGDI